MNQGSLTQRLRGLENEREENVRQGEEIEKSQAASGRRAGSNEVEARAGKESRLMNIDQ